MSLVELLDKAEVRSFITEHANDDPIKLILKQSSYPELPIKEIAHQIHCKKKAKSKLPEWFSNDAVIYPPGVSLEQSSSELTAQYKASLIKEKSLTDLTGGFGIDSYYLAQKVERLDYVEQNAELIPVVKHNFDHLGVDNVCFHNQNAEQYLSEEFLPSDVYYIDPARRDEAKNKVFRIEDCSPDLNKILPVLLKKGKKVWIKLSPLLDIKQSLEKFDFISEIHVVSVQNECKELLFEVRPDYKSEVNVKCINIHTSDDFDVFEFNYHDEENIPRFSFPKKYIYEPNTSIMKGGGFNSVANKFGLEKLHRNSHLYTSDNLVQDFQGRKFELIELSVVNKKKLKSILPHDKANITVRNYPDTVQQIRKKTSIKDGGDIYIFATTLMDGSLKALICRRC